MTVVVTNVSIPELEDEFRNRERCPHFGGQMATVHQPLGDEGVVVGPNVRGWLLLGVRPVSEVTVASTESDDPLFAGLVSSKGRRRVPMLHRYGPEKA